MNVDVLRAHQAAFWSQVERADDHWLWKGPISSKGSGRWSHYDGEKQRFISARRAAALLADLPAHSHARRNCDAPNCVRPEHWGQTEERNKRIAERAEREALTAQRRLERETERVQIAERRAARQKEVAEKKRAQDELHQRRRSARAERRGQRAAPTWEELPERGLCQSCGETKPKADMQCVEFGTEWVLTQRCRDCQRTHSLVYSRESRSTLKGMIVAKMGTSRSRARDKAMDFNLTHAFLRELWAKQEGRCALTGVPMVLDTTNYHCVGLPTSPSLDRIDSKKGYTQDNVRWVLLAVNVALRDWGLAEVLPIFEALVARQAEAA